MAWRYWDILEQRIRQAKLTKFTKILNYFKSSCIMFCTKMFSYPNYIYFLLENSTHFGLEVSRHFELYQVFIHNFFMSKCLDIPITYFLQEKSTNFYRRVLTNFGLGVWGDFKPKNYTKNIYKICKNFWTISSLHV